VIGGSYRLKSLIGKGGMGYVFLAEHNIIGQNYALKIIIPTMMSEVSLARFEAEARTIAKLDHPNIVKVYNMGLDQGDCPFYVMDLLTGKSLDEILVGEGPIAPLPCLKIFHQAALGLDYAHRKQVVHRDIKPSNLILLPPNGSEGIVGDGQVKIVDFGIAKSGAAGVKGQALTATGEIVGSPFYMSPEQCMGKNIDARSDIYSLGCSLFECLTGVPPYRGGSPVHTLMMHLESALPKLLLRSTPEIDLAQLDLLLARMLAKNPEERYQSMAQVAHDVERLIQRKPIGETAHTAGSRRHHGNLASANARNEDLAREETQSTYSNLWYQSEAGKWSIAILSICLFSAALLTVLSLTNKQEKPDSRSDTTAGANSKSISEDQKQSAAENAAESELKQTLAQMGPFNNGTMLKNGVMMTKFVFPDTQVGILAQDGIQHPAMGEVMVRKDHDIIFSIDENLNPAAFACPEIIQHFRAGDLSSLVLRAQANKTTNDTTLIPTGVSQRRQAALLNESINLTSLKLLSLDGFRENQEFLDHSTRLTNLRTILLTKSAVNMKALAKSGLLDQLEYLSIDSPIAAEIDPVLKRLATSKHLIGLRLKSLFFSDGSFAEMKENRSIEKVTLISVVVTNSIAKTLTQMKGLKEIFIEDDGYTPLDPGPLITLDADRKLKVIYRPDTAIPLAPNFKTMYPHVRLTYRYEGI
jgi:serine/threonine protein kinase